MVLVKEPDQWRAYFRTDPALPARQVLERAADRGALEQTFKNVKEIWGAGQQQLRNYWANIAAYHLTMWLHTLIELWAWRKPHPRLVDRSDSPWDDATRRPSHADRRNALCRQTLETEFRRETAGAGVSRKIRRLCTRLLKLAA